MTGAALTLAFATGLLGSFGHCLAMCGPLATGVGRRAGGEGRRGVLLATASYHAGRVFTYALLGGVMGLSGSFVDTAGRLAGVQQAVGLGAGLVMVVTGLGVLTSARWLRAAEGTLGTKLKGAFRRLLGGRGAGRAFVSGLGLGLLPCGLSYSMLLGAAATGGAGPGLVYALLFGAGTVPALLGLGVAADLAGQRWRGAVQKLGALAVVATGAVFIVDGLRQTFGR